MKTQRNDKEREMWVMNWEPLYLWWKVSRCGITKFIRENRKDIDFVIDKELNKEPKR